MYLVIRDGFAVTRNGNGNDADVAHRLGPRPTLAQGLAYDRPR